MPDESGVAVRAAYPRLSSSNRRAGLCPSDRPITVIRTATEPSRDFRMSARADSFKAKVVLVTGAAGGVGLATARAFRDAGASVIVADRNIALLETAAVGPHSAGHQVLALGCDVTDRGHDID